MKKAPRIITNEDILDGVRKPTPPPSRKHKNNKRARKSDKVGRKDKYKTKDS